jgi:hypothetical protein
MSPGERRLTAHLLRLASGQFSNHGCNDFDLVPFIPDPDERDALVLEAFGEYVPEDNKCLMIAVVDELIHAGVIQPGNFEVQERTTGVASDDRLREHMDCVNQGRCWMTVRQEAVEGPCPALASWQAARQRAFAPLSGCTCGASGGMDGHALTCGLNRVSFGRDDV